MHRSRPGKVFCIVTAIAGLIAIQACADDVVSGDIKAAEVIVPESASRVHATKSREEKKSLPPWFPGRLVPKSTRGLRLKSLEIFGVAPKKNSALNSVGYRADFVWGVDKIAQQAWESPVKIFMITYDEKTQKQNVRSSGPVLRVYAGHPIQVTSYGTVELPGLKGDGCWVTVIIVGRDSATESARLLANQTKFVHFAPAGDNLSGLAIRNPGSGSL